MNKSKIYLVIAIALLLYLPFLYLVESVSDAYSEEVEGLMSIEKIMSEEIQSLIVCQDYDIEIVLIDQNEAPYALKVGEGKYIIGLYEKNNRSTIKHELYHIEDVHTDVLYSNNLKGSIERELRYLFLHEPNAALYSLI